MDKITKASLLLDAFDSLNYATNEAESRIDSNFSPTEQYWKYLSEEESRLVSITFNEFLNEDTDFLYKLFNVDSSFAPLTPQYAVSFLRSYVDSHHPRYLDDLLDDAETLRDEGLLICSALCIRLYCETAFKNRYPKYRNSRRSTLGYMFRDFEHVMESSVFEKHLSNIDRLNAIVHNTEDHINNPSTSNEITTLIKWATKFEYIINNLPNPRS